MTKTRNTAPDTPSARLQAVKARLDAAHAELAATAAAVLRDAEIARFQTELLAAEKRFVAAADGMVWAFRRMNACADAIKRRGGRFPGGADFVPLALLVARQAVGEVRACTTAERTAADRAIVERDVCSALDAFKWQGLTP